MIAYRHTVAHIYADLESVALIASKCREAAGRCIAQSPAAFVPAAAAACCSTRQEELEIALQVAHEVNAHLNNEVMQLTQQVEALQQERDACLAHIKVLAQKVAEERSKSAVRPAAPSHCPGLCHCVAVCASWSGV